MGCLPQRAWTVTLKERQILYQRVGTSFFLTSELVVGFLIHYSTGLLSTA